jgi:hypothetical protein
MEEHMGWWQIDPETGKPAQDFRSKLSKPPDFVLLNAVPGVDDKRDAHYLGDEPWDMAETMVSELQKLFSGVPRPFEEEIRRLLLDRLIPTSLAGLDTESTDHLLQSVDEMWKDVDYFYQEDWGRPSHTAEKKWICEFAIRRLLKELDENTRNK